MPAFLDRHIQRLRDDHKIVALTVRNVQEASFGRRNRTMAGLGRDTMKQENPQQAYFRVTDSVPEQTWYWLAIASILASAGFKLANKDHWALFVGQWPPTFILFALFHRVLRPSGS
jgi:hypothetical protein